MFASMTFEQRMEQLHQQGDAVVQAVITNGVLLDDGSKAYANQQAKGKYVDTRHPPPMKLPPDQLTSEPSPPNAQSDMLSAETTMGYPAPLDLSLPAAAPALAPLLSSRWSQQTEEDRRPWGFEEDPRQALSAMDERATTHAMDALMEDCGMGEREGDAEMQLPAASEAAAAKAATVVVGGDSGTASRRWDGSFGGGSSGGSFRSMIDTPFANCLEMPFAARPDSPTLNGAMVAKAAAAAASAAAAAARAEDEDRRPSSSSMPPPGSPHHSLAAARMLMPAAAAAPFWAGNRNGCGTVTTGSPRRGDGCGMGGFLPASPLSTRPTHHLGGGGGGTPNSALPVAAAQGSSTKGRRPEALQLKLSDAPPTPTRSSHSPACPPPYMAAAARNNVAAVPASLHNIRQAPSPGKKIAGGIPYPSHLSNPSMGGGGGGIPPPPWAGGPPPPHHGPSRFAKSMQYAAAEWFAEEAEEAPGRRSASGGCLMQARSGGSGSTLALSHLSGGINKHQQQHHPRVSGGGGSRRSASQRLSRSQDCVPMADVEGEVDGQPMHPFMYGAPQAGFLPPAAYHHAAYMAQMHPGAAMRHPSRSSQSMMETSCPLEPMPYLQSRAVSMNLADDYWAAAAAAVAAAAAGALPDQQQQRHNDMSSCGGQPQPARPRYRLQQPLSLTERNSAPPGSLDAAMALMPTTSVPAPAHPPPVMQQAAVMAGAAGGGGAPQGADEPMAVDDVPEAGWVAAVTCHERFKKDRQAVLLSNTLVQFLFDDLNDLNPQEPSAGPVNSEMLQQLSAAFAAQSGEDARRSSHAAAVAAAEMATSERRESELGAAATAAKASSAEQSYYHPAAACGMPLSGPAAVAARLRQDSDECMRHGAAAAMSLRGCKRQQQQLPAVLEGCPGLEQQQQQRIYPSSLAATAMPAHSAHFQSLHLRPAGQTAFSMTPQQQPSFVSAPPTKMVAAAAAVPLASLLPPGAAASLRSSARRTTTDSIGDFDSLLDGLMNEDGEGEAEQFFA